MFVHFEYSNFQLRGHAFNTTNSLKGTCYQTFSTSSFVISNYFVENINSILRKRMTLHVLIINWTTSINWFYLGIPIFFTSIFPSTEFQKSLCGTNLEDYWFWWTFACSSIHIGAIPYGRILLFKEGRIVIIVWYFVDNILLSKTIPNSKWEMLLFGRIII